MNFSDLAPTVSVIVPFYNRRGVLARAVESVLAQTRPVDEIILVDDGSTDGSLDIALRYEKNNDRVTVLSQPNAGVAAARNAGLARAKGEWLAFIDSDDEWHRQKNELCLQLIASRPDVEFVHTSHQSWHGGKKILRPRNSRQFREKKEELLSTLGIKTSTVMFHRCLMEKAGFFRTDLTVCEDYELFWKMVAAARAVGYLTEHLVNIERSSNSLTATTVQARQKTDGLKAMTSSLRWMREYGCPQELVASMRRQQYLAFVDTLSFGIKSRDYVGVLRNWAWSARERGKRESLRVFASALRRGL